MDFGYIPTPRIIFGVFNIMTERMIGGANRWTDFVKKWASDHDVTYTCAISLPDCKKEYYEMIGKTPKPAKPKAPPKESASPWVQFVREWAKKKGVSYSCAVAMSECGAEYRALTGAKANPKTLANQSARKASKQAKVRGRTAVSLAEMGKSAKTKVAKAEATISKAIDTAVKKRRGRPPKVAEPELEYETNYTPPATPKRKGPPSGPPPITPEQVAEVKKAQKRDRMAQLRAERKAQGKSSSGKTFTRPRGSKPAIQFEILEEALPTEAKKGFSKATVDEIKASLIRRAEEAKTPPQGATATPTLVPPAPPKAKKATKATKASKAMDTKDALRLVQDTFNVMLSEEGDVDDGDWLRERGFPVPPQGLIGLNDNFVWFYTSPIAQREMEDAITRAIALAKSTYGVDVSREELIAYPSGMTKGHQSYFYAYQPDWMTAERPVLDFVNPPKKKGRKPTGGYFKIGSRSFGKKHGGMFEDDEIIEESGPYERAKPTEQELMGREDTRREELAEREANALFDDDELVDDDDFLEGDEIIEESGPYPRPRPTEQEMMGREDARTEELTNREADRLLGRGRGCAPCLKDYDMIIKHLLEHITDPEEPIDPRDYDHAIHFIKRIRRMKGGVLHLMRQRHTAVPLLGGVNEDEQERIEAEQLRNFSGDVKGQVRRRIAELNAYRQKLYARSNKYAGHPTADAINHEIEQLEDYLESGRTPREPERPDGPRPPDLLSPFPLSDDFIASPRFEEFKRNTAKYGRNIRDFAGKGWEEKPAKSGNAFLDAITTIGHEAGKAHPASKFVNPFDAGFKFGEKVVAPALMKTKLGNPKTGIFSKKFWTPKKKHH
jgi:hypothetical protein